MPGCRLALAQVNTTVGDLAGNAELLMARTREAARAGADLVAFPEMALTGYPIEDLALRGSFQRATERALIALAGDLATAGLGEITVVVGYLGSAAGADPRNAAAVLRGGQVTHRYAKFHLPSYGVFDEERLFEPGTKPCVFEVRGVRISLAICEDIWQEEAPALDAARANADVLLVINASPYEKGKQLNRIQLCQRRARQTGRVVAYAALTGGQDELVFDGGSLVVRADGELAAQAPQFAECLLLADIADGTVLPGEITAPLQRLAEIHAALVVGLRDYVRKNGMTSVVLGLSGGIDSALCASLACDALGPRNVHGISLPSRYSSEHSVGDAVALAHRTGLRYRTVAIGPMFDAFMSQLHLAGLAEENLQARIRGTTLMALSNSEGHLVLATGNKSELAVGYSTIYGDAVGGFAPLKDVPKTLVWELARWRNDQAAAAGQTPPIPERSISKPPSAELRPGQLDTDSLPDYAGLDDLLEGYVLQDRGASELVAAGFDPRLVEKIIRLTDQAEWKRRQYPPGTKISARAFGRDRRLPITSHWREPRLSEPGG